jgi:hypothetical protein
MEVAEKHQQVPVFAWSFTDVTGLFLMTRISWRGFVSWARPCRQRNKADNTRYDLI